MYTIEQINALLQDSEAQQNISPMEWKEIRDELAILLADKPVSLRKYRAQIDALRKVPLKRHVAPKPQHTTTMVSRTAASEGKTVCRICGATLSATAKNVLEHYEKKHYSEYIRNKAIMTTKPFIFVTTKK